MTVTLRSGVVAQATIVDPPNEDSASALIWRDPGGLIVAVSGRNVGSATVIEVANSVRFVTEQQWRDELKFAPNGRTVNCP